MYFVVNTTASPSREEKIKQKAATFRFVSIFVPFIAPQVYLHAMVRDAHGRKMSKSLGNIINPVDVIQGIGLEDLHKTLLGGNIDPREVEKAKQGQKQDYPNGIPECGTDALRFALCAYTAQGWWKVAPLIVLIRLVSLVFFLAGRDINLDVLRVQGYRFFCNKLWNATKFAMMYLGKGFKPEVDIVASLHKKPRTDKSSSDKSAAFVHSALPPAADMNSTATFGLLNACLASSPFLSSSHPSQVDVVAFESLKEQPSHWNHPHLSRWYHNLNAHTAEERKAFPGGLGVLTPRPAPLTAMDRWILSRLSYAVSACNEGIASYNFPQATTALYNFWLYELCDVYLECLKPVFQGTDAAAATTARNVLYVCLDAALRLISPFMPFISEELFQRLPRKSDREPPSIVVTRYPEAAKLPFRDQALEAEVELVQKIVSGVRSARSDYTLPNKVKTNLFLNVYDKDLSRRLEGYTDVVGTLAYCSDVKVTSSPPEDNCAVVTVSDKCSAHIVLSGLIDPAKEKVKLEKKKEQLKAQLEKLKAATKVQGYEEKVPAEVRAANKEKAAQTEAEIKRIEEAVVSLSKFRQE